MVLPVWLPFALKAGSMVSSGIGNYLEGKNQERYSRRVMRMQQEAMRKRETAERKAGMANIFFGLGGRTPMQPVYQAAPEIDPYEKSGSARIWGGIGKGLSYASTAVSAYDTIRNTMIAQAEQAGIKAGASRLPDAMSKARPAISVTDPVIPQLPGVSVIDPGVVTSFKPVEHYSEVLSHLGKATSDSEGLFSGWFADARTEAYDRGFNTSKGALLRDYQGKLIDTLQDQREFNLSVRQFDFLEQNKKAQEARLKKTLTYQQKLLDLETTQGKTELAQARSFKLVEEKKEFLAASIHKDSVIGKAQLKISAYDNLENIANTHDGIKFENGIFTVDPKFEGMSAFEWDKFVKTLLRLSSNEALNESDLTRLDNSAETWGAGLDKLFRNLYRGFVDLGDGTEITTGQQFKEVVTPENLAGILNMIHADKQYLQGQVILPQIGLNVEALAKVWKGNLNLLGVTDPDVFKAEFTDLLIHRHLPNLDLSTINVAETVKIPAEQLIQNTLDLGAKDDDPLLKYKDIYRERPGAGKQVVTPAAKELSKAAKTEYLRLQGLKKHLHKVSTFRFAESKFGGKSANIRYLEAQIKEGVEQFEATYGSYPSPETPIIDWLEDLGGKFLTAPMGGYRMDVDEYLLNTHSKASETRLRHPTEHLNSTTIDTLEQLKEEDRSKNLSVLDGLQAYTQSMRDSNYQWGQALFNTQLGSGMSSVGGGLAPEFNPAMMNIAPGTGDFPVEAGIARAGSPIGLGGMYSNLSQTYLNAPTMGSQRSFNRPIMIGDNSWYNPQSQYVNRAQEDWNRVQSGQISGRYRGVGGRYAPVPAYGR